MEARTLRPVVERLRQAGRSADDDTSDAHLLARFAEDNDADAFAALVRRHGPMVLGVCRRVLRHRHDAEDAFQATFLVLARKAVGLKHSDRLTGWLYGVAHRTALKARTFAGRRRFREGPLSDIPDPSPGDDPAWAELRPMLDAAISRLPDRYRTVIVLCHLQGLTYAQAARRLGCAEGTVAARLTRARRKLRARLERGGVALPAGALAACYGRDAAAGPPPELVVRMLLAAGDRSSAAGVVQTLTQQVSRAMLMKKLTAWGLLTTLTACLVVGGFGFLDRHAVAEGGAPRAAPAPAAPVPSEEALRPPPEEPVEVIATRPAYESKNFRVHAPNARIAKLVAEAAERERKEKAILWLGNEMPPWPTPCTITVAVSYQGVSGATTFQFDRGRVVEQRMLIQGPLDRTLASTLPHEVTHTVLAHNFGEPLPRWADEGAAVLSEEPVQVKRHEQLARELIQADRALRLAKLFPMREYPGDAIVSFAQGASVTRFLVAKKDRKTFLAFVKQGLKGDWDAAAREHYGFASVDDLERSWHESLRADRTAERPPAPPKAGELSIAAEGGTVRIKGDGFTAVALNARLDPETQRLTLTGSDADPVVVYVSDPEAPKRMKARVVRVSLGGRKFEMDGIVEVAE